MSNEKETSKGQAYREIPKADLAPPQTDLAATRSTIFGKKLNLQKGNFVFATV